MRIFLIFLILAAGGAGLLLGKKEKISQLDDINLSQFPVIENKTFAIIVYACNQSAWCEKALRSIFEQDYDYYRVIFIDDASNDNTLEKAKNFIIDRGEEHRVILIHNEKREGFAQSLQRAVDGCLDKEIALLVESKDWFVHSSILSHLNEAYQDPSVWLVFSSAIEYPSYAKLEPSHLAAPCSFYAGMMKQVQLNENYRPELREMAQGHIRCLSEPSLFSNCASGTQKKI